MEGKGGRRQRRAGRAVGAAVRRGQAVLLLGQRGTGRGGFIRLCHATDQGAALPRQDRWRGKPSHVTGQRFRSSPRQPAAAPPCMERHRPWQ